MYCTQDSFVITYVLIKTCNYDCCIRGGYVIGNFLMFTHTLTSKFDSKCLHSFPAKLYQDCYRFFGMQKAQVHQYIGKERAEILILSWFNCLQYDSFDPYTKYDQIIRFSLYIRISQYKPCTNRTITTIAHHVNRTPSLRNLKLLKL